MSSRTGVFPRHKGEKPLTIPPQNPSIFFGGWKKHGRRNSPFFADRALKLRVRNRRLFLTLGRRASKHSRQMHPLFRLRLARGIRLGSTVRVSVNEGGDRYLRNAPKHDLSPLVHRRERPESIHRELFDVLAEAKDRR
jgi:hypothetical protein